MCRILLSKNGDFNVVIKDLGEISNNKIIISDKAVDPKNIFLYHKVTYRPYYEKSLEKIKRNEIYDEIFFNTKGELSEGSRSNIILKLNGELYTPPLECGLLNGTYRQKMLNDGICKEKILYKEDLLKAENIYCINSVRGMREVYL